MWSPDVSTYPFYIHKHTEKNVTIVGLRNKKVCIFEQCEFDIFKLFVMNLKCRDLLELTGVK